MKRYISAILIPCFLLQIFGCYSMNEVTDNCSDTDNIKKIFLQMKDGKDFEFHKFNPLNQSLKDTTKSFFTNYEFKDSSLILVSIKLSKDKVRSKDTIIYKKQDLLSLTCEKYPNEPDETDLIFWIIGAGIMAGFVILLNHIENNFPKM
jgi:hypothetical protein